MLYSCFGYNSTCLIELIIKKTKDIQITFIFLIGLKVEIKKRTKFLYIYIHVLYEVD